MARLTVAQVNALDRAGFVAAFGCVAEHSPWVAEAAADAGPFASLTALHAALVAAIAAAGPERRLELLRAHPDLAGRAALAGELTAASSGEQAAAGLDRLTGEEFARFGEMNRHYRERFGFPFVMAVRHADKHRILAAFAHRLRNDPAREAEEAVGEVAKIVWLRLLDLVVPQPTGRLTTHVLDTAAGIPAAGVPVELYGLDGGRTLLRSDVTDADGRLPSPALAGDALVPGRYELLFRAGIYFAAAGRGVAALPFLDEVPIRFAVSNPEQHHHVPLLLSPWSFSTYRGS